MCQDTHGFNDPDKHSHYFLMQWAIRVKEEAFDTVDTSTWSQAQREQFAEYELRKATESRNVKNLKVEKTTRASLHLLRPRVY